MVLLTEVREDRKEEAVCRLYYQGLFRGHPAKPYYESIDDVGDLLVGLLDLQELMTETNAE